MSAFYRFSSFLSRPLGLGVACGLIFGSAILASTKPRMPVNAKRRRPTTRDSGNSFKIRRPSSSGRVPDMVYRYWNVFGGPANGLTKARPELMFTLPPPLSPQSSLLFQGSTFGKPESVNLPELPRNLLSPLSILQPPCSLQSSPLTPLSVLRSPGSPRSSLLFQEAIFDDSSLVAPTNLSPLTLQFSCSGFSSDLGPADNFITHDDIQHNSLLVMDDDQSIPRGDSPLATGELVSERQDIPSVIPGFGATLTISDGGVEDRLAIALSGLKTQASNERLSLTLLVEFRGNTLSAGRIIQDIIDNLKDSLECLTVYMPNEDHDHIGFPSDVELSQPLVAPTEDSALQHLLWKGHVISDLFSQWGSASNIPFGALRTLNLTCDLSLDDCIQILFQAENVVDFVAHSLGEFPSLMKHDFHKKNVAQLTSLTITSAVSLDKLPKTLQMSGLTSINLEFGSETSFPDVTSVGIVWAMLQSVRIVNIPSKLYLEEIREICSNAKQLHLEALDGTSLRK